MKPRGGTGGRTLTRRQRWLRWGRITITIAAVAYLASRVDPGEVWTALQKLSPGAAISALGVVFVGLGLGAMRWRLLLHAYGAIDIPSWVRLAHLYLVGHFYNTYAPGGVGGDVVRGVASRKAFGDVGWASATSGVAVVFIERVLGVSALLALAGGAYLFYPLPGLENVGWWASLGMATGAAAIGAIAIAPRLTPWIPDGLAAPIRALPRLFRGGPFVGAIVVSLMIHALNVVAGHLIMHSLDPGVRLSESAVAMPLIAASAFFPFTVGGAGVREAAFAVLYGAVGVPEATAYAGSLSFWACNLIAGGVGGLINLWIPISGGPDDR